MPKAAPPTPSSRTAGAGPLPRARVDGPPRRGRAWPRWRAPRRRRSRRHLDRLGQPPPTSTCSSTGRAERRASALSAGRRPPSDRIAGWMPRDSSRSSSRAAVRPSAPRPVAPGSVRRHRRLAGAHLQQHRDQPLLDAVVQVPLDPPARLVAGGHDPCPGGGQLLPAVLQRDRHRVEADLQDADLADPVFGRARQVAGREPVCHRRRAAHRLDDRAGEVAREQGDQQDRPADADPRGDDGPLVGGVGAAFAGGRQATLGRQEAVELGPDGFDPPLALLGGRDAAGRRQVPP